MKSGPILAGVTASPRAESAAIRPVATVVLPTPEWVPATTRRGPRVGITASCHDGEVRIVSLLPSATEIVYALGLGDDLVGVTHECDWPPEARRKQVVSVSTLPPAASPAEIDRRVSESLDGGETIYRLDTDAVQELQPDVVLTQDLCAVCAVPSGHVHEALDLVGSPAAVISLDPGSLDDVLGCVLAVGAATATEAIAAEVVAALRRRLDA